MESISRISSLLESARELTLDASSAARSSFRNPTARPLDSRQIKKLLDSRADREVLDGLRRVTTMACRGQQTLPFFSSVVKNVASPNLEIKKLVYIYVVHHAEQEPDMALLSINTIQKSLSDANPQVRALALRTMSAIQVPVISHIVSLAIKKGAADMSPYVRRAAALAIPKCYRLDPRQLPQLIEYLVVLLGDKQYYVAGAAVTAFSAVCPERLDLIHAHYRDLVRKLVDMDEWSQLATLRMLTIYARKCFPRRTKTVALKAVGALDSSYPNPARKKAARTLDLGDFYSDAPVELGDGADANRIAVSSTPVTQTVVDLDPDLVLLLDAIRPLLQSRNAGVVTAVTRCYISIGTPEYVRDAIGPLVALLRGPQDIQQVALYNIASVCLSYPADFVRYATRFLVGASDPPVVWRLKLEILALLFPHSPPSIKSLILSELEHFARGADKALVREAVRAIGRCAQAVENTTNAIDTVTAARCLRLLLAQVTSIDGTLAAESLTVIRHLIQQDPTAHGPTVVRLAKNLDAAADPQARATIIWLVGEFAGLNGEDNIAADVLRILLNGFADESEAAKRQIVLLAAKVYLHHINREAERNPTPKKAEALETASEPAPAPTPASHDVSIPDGFTDDGGFADLAAPTQSPSPLPTPPDALDHPVRRLWEYVLLLARYDTSYDLRDRTRLYRSLLEVPQLATLMLLAPKPAPHAPSPSEVRRGFTLGSAALVLGTGGGSSSAGGTNNGQGLLHGIRGYEALPDWVRDGDEPDARLRDTESSPNPYEDREQNSGVGAGNSRYVAAGDSLDRAAAKGRSAVVRSANGQAVGQKASAKTLDDWLDEEEEEEEEEEEDEDSDEEEEEEDSSDEDEDSDAEEESEEEEEEDSSEEEDEDAESDSGEEGDHLMPAKSQRLR
ncbi:AP-3 complex subunit beta [Sporothrix epigloea]|uniref:AP-3 complex subunit beta n=1 Tax=Sporothrix epigloea TaxID=1892477 RepID=A0ABP0D7J1_9PEZI